jgi:hypothetical protein
MAQFQQKYSKEVDGVKCNVRIRSELQKNGMLLGAQCSIENPVLATRCFSLFLGASHTLQKIAEKLTGVRAAPAGWDDPAACATHRFPTP